ncbi:hypothetical protein SAMN06295987_104300 [Novosphingobium mathurense]|uniref:Uncharacterized protein n=1 Tax=Novosphingobium mathurense TaxID=428990 RepID=A0A1U6I7B3_9SPHN|nr:hypothetical protein SAMN06295987_104300 [Novosphingobium mathurense]
MASTNMVENLSTMVLKVGGHPLPCPLTTICPPSCEKMVDKMVDALSHCFFVAISPLSTVYFLFHKREKKREKRGLKKEYARTVDGGHAR